jgi:hypothetical protein
VRDLKGGHEALRRWGPLAGAAVVTVLLAGGVAVMADQLVAPRVQPAPQLHTVSTATLTRLGLSLGPGGEPPYCPATDQAVQRGWLHAGAVGCPISRATAESLARRGGRARVVESLLARVTSTRPSIASHDQLTWLVVTQSSGVNVAVGVGAGGGWTGTNLFAFNQLVLVDAHTGTLTGLLPLSPAGPGGGRRTYPSSSPGLAVGGGSAPPVTPAG